ncbi:hypothetical protein D1007_24965 [Hordeum vulgare]|nr:hypothetical protein D1007_24965 [Hordeum vulgare]
MAKASKVSPTLNPNISHDDDVDDNGDENNDEESDNIASLKIKGEMIFKSLYKNKLAYSNFLEIMSIATEGKKYIEELEAHLEEHEATIETMEGHEREYANEIAELSQALENEQTTKESLEETFAIELSRLNESHDRALEIRELFLALSVEFISFAGGEYVIRLHTVARNNIITYSERHQDKEIFYHLFSKPHAAPQESFSNLLVLRGLYHLAFVNSYQEKTLHFI